MNKAISILNPILIARITTIGGIIYGKYEPLCW